MAISTIPGYLRDGKGRELEHALEAYRAGKLPMLRLLRRAAGVQAEGWRVQHEAGLDLVPVNDFSLYDHVLDAAAMLGAVPPRYEWAGEQVDLGTLSAMARGGTGEWDVAAMDTAQWFDTAYRYVVPELAPDGRFKLASEKPLEELSEAQAAGIPAKPVLLGPITFLLLSKPAGEPFPVLETLLPRVLPVYARMIALLSAAGAEWIQLDEPALARDRMPEELGAVQRAYRKLGGLRGRAKLLVQTAHGHVGEAYDALVGLPVEGIGLDLADGREGNLRLLEERGWPAEKWLSAGVVDGRNVWANDLGASLAVLRRVVVAGADPARLMVSASYSLLHVPHEAWMEEEPNPELRDRLSFAEQKLAEVVTLARALNEGEAAVAEELAANRRVIEGLAASAG